MKLFGKPKVGGDLKFYRLEGWWYSTLTESERKTITTRFPAKVSGPSPDWTSANVSNFLWSWSTWFRKTPEERAIARKMLTEAVVRARAEKTILDEHFSWGNLVEVWYRDRELLPEALEQTIAACKAQIAIAAKTADAFRREYQGHPVTVPPTHRGYEQLRIIYEKQKQYDEAIALVLDMQRTGWADDVSAYVAKLTEKKARTIGGRPK